MSKQIESLKDCPFCGERPNVRYIGNDVTKKRAIEIRCPKCRIKRTDATLRYSFDQMEEVAIRNWNQRWGVQDGKAD